MATYLAGLTFASLGENFKGATDAMAWLLTVATQITKDTGTPIEWTTPLGWPVLQPYFDIKKRRVRTVFHDMTVVDDDEDLEFMRNNAKAPVKNYKQKQALPPNFVHSLDSSHMLATATACRSAGLTFAAVHDSYWTHACDMPVMNELLREEFVKLHEKASLEKLHEQLSERYGHALEDALEEPPEVGELDIQVVKDSTYFFS